jgi:hypothetical protein
MSSTPYYRQKEAQLRYAALHREQRRESSRLWRLKRKASLLEAQKRPLVAFDPTKHPQESEAEYDQKMKEKLVEWEKTHKDEW